MNASKGTLLNLCLLKYKLWHPKLCVLESAIFRNEVLFFFFLRLKV